jgi:iron(III)-salmochelin esterase
MLVRVGITMKRRQLLAAASGAWMGSLVASTADAADAGEGWSLREITIDGDRHVGQRFSLLTPTHTTAKVPLLVLLHGLGETHDQHIGARAWVDRYGLTSAYERLLKPPVLRANAKYRYWTDALLTGVNAQLRERPFRGIAIACPFTPNVYKAKAGRKLTLDRYAAWVVDQVIPAARKQTNVLTDRAHTYLDGCSLGGYVGAEVFLRRPEAFGAWGTLQGALGAHRVAGYAERIADVVKHARVPIHVETSTGDTFRQVNERFSKALESHHVPHELVTPPGPHNQPFLRDSGTLLKLLWYDRLPR